MTFQTCNVIFSSVYIYLISFKFLCGISKCMVSDHLVLYSWRLRSNLNDWVVVLFGAGSDLCKQSWLLHRLKDANAARPNTVISWPASSFAYYTGSIAKQRQSAEDRWTFPSAGSTFRTKSSAILNYYECRKHPLCVSCILFWSTTSVSVTTSWNPAPPPT